ncbi:MAG: carbonic anhydrase family protein [Pseudomonadota bacterium]
MRLENRGAAWALLLVSPMLVAGEGTHWGYGASDGPDRWGAMDPAWDLCASGEAQSPVDIRGVETVDRLGDVKLAAGRAEMKVVRQRHVFDALDNGHTIQINVDAGDTLTLEGKQYDLVQFHFHAPSEHTVDGRHYPMEMHLVHQAVDGSLAVVGVFIEDGDHNAAFDTIWENLPTTAGEMAHLEDVAMNVDDALPVDNGDWRYEGSLTTPPCTEGVRWVVMQQPIEFDTAQIDRFRAIFSGNNRPVQALHGRAIVAETMTVD